MGPAGHRATLLYVGRSFQGVMVLRPVRKEDEGRATAERNLQKCFEAEARESGTAKREVPASSFLRRCHGICTAFVQAFGQAADQLYRLQ